MPHPAMQNEVGSKFHHLTVLNNLGVQKVDCRTNPGAASEYQCDCGSTIIELDSIVRTGRKKSCGAKGFCPFAHKSTKGYRWGILEKTNPGMGYSKDLNRMPGWYRSYRAMRSRCLNPNATGYGNYGGRGITICDRWLENPMNFYEDMGERPEGMTIDRIEVDGNYEPGNCKWATAMEQAQNKRK